ncbi:MAG: hypothetical protein WB421_03255, partial [Terriglobales bacterium]
TEYWIPTKMAKVEVFETCTHTHAHTGLVSAFRTLEVIAVSEEIGSLLNLISMLAFRCICQ